ncbi:hypothetical protein EV421DRAFT_1896692 [Armillaria borealis]|uniref:Uncharacterized protein n=1 Tax=Armillaria borealis TaxID=47425 RepID=A0AA39K7M1_9AGAR|nr:hypothetical protein EV421DRAFT_1896692 [Armillaria borealis]
MLTSSLLEADPEAVTLLPALAREGLEVAVFEASKFPRYHIGESLIPSVRHYLRFIGAEDKLANHGFVRKPGAALKFRQHAEEGYTDFVAIGHNNNAWNVDRSEFDLLLMNHARTCGTSRPIAAAWTHTPPPAPISPPASPKVSRDGADSPEILSEPIKFTGTTTLELARRNKVLLGSKDQLTNPAGPGSLPLTMGLLPQQRAVEVDEKDVSRLVYHAATPESVQAWADRTCIVHRQDFVDLNDLRELVCGAKVPSSADDDATWFHVAIPKGTDSISKLGFLLHTQYAPFDGAALSFILDLYLAQLAKVLSSGTYAPDVLPWGKEVDNLLQATMNILASHEPQPIHTSSGEAPTANHPYYESLLKAMEAMGVTFPNPNLWGFRHREADPGWPVCARKEVTLSKTESAAVMDALKKLKKDHAFTLTHLVHATLAMTVINDNPPTPDQSSGIIAPQALANCRDRLKEPYASANGYAGNALGVSAIRIPIKIFMEDDGKLLPMSKETLINACSHIREEYKLQRELPATLSYMDQGCQALAGGMKAGALANAIDRLRIYKIPPDQCYKFSSDGKGETLLQGVYLDANGKQLFEISKWFTALNQVDPAPFFRFFSWKGCIILSCDVNKNVTSLEDTKGYMQKWKEYIMMITK